MGLRKISDGTPKRLRIISAIIALQLFVSIHLIGWWGYIIWAQADRVSELDLFNGGAVNVSKRMVIWEGTWFFCIFLISGLFIYGLYRRDLKRSRSLQAFFASLTHELKTPLTSIRLQAESISEVSVSDSYLKKLIGRLLQDTSRLESEVERTLELARMEGGGRLFKEEIDLGQSLKRILTPWISQHQGRIEVKSSIESSQIVGDSAALQIVLKNLLENSLRHGNKEKIEVELNASESHEKITLNYRDNGAGVFLDEKRLGQLFERGPKSSGAGVGLYLIRVLMQKMGGDAKFKISNGFEANLVFQKGEGLV